MLVRKEALVESETMEFPRINYRWRGKENKFFYALGREYLHPNTVRRGRTLDRFRMCRKRPHIRHFEYSYTVVGHYRREVGPRYMIL